MNVFHQSVLLQEAVDFLNVRPGAQYIDATLGGGGHTEGILRRGGKVLALDQDEEALAHVRAKNLENLTVVKENFSHIYKAAIENGWDKVDGIIFDLGVSSHQLDTPERGFSFANDGPLDMRMDRSLKITAFDIVNNFDKRRLNEIFHKYGEEKLSLAIADAIVSARQVKPIGSTGELARIAREVYAKKHFKGKLNEATKVFQALRIVTNSELMNLEEALPQTTKLLHVHGRLVVISFQSLEDKLVKRFFKNTKTLLVLTKKPIGPSLKEVSQNPRSRSAKLRAAEKI